MGTTNGIPKMAHKNLLKERKSSPDFENKNVYID